MIIFYFRVYVYLVTIYLWYRFLLMFIGDLRVSKKYPLLKAKTSVIVPVYNEKSDLLQLCISSLCEAYGDNEIIVVDDKSTNHSWEKMVELKKKFPKIKIVRLKENRGKRYAQYVGLHFATGDFIVTVDSDSIVKKDAIIELIKPFSDPKVGATTGNVRAFNRERNFLTKMIDARYKNAFTFERQGLSSFGVVTCCSGVISAYRRENLLEIKDKYITQKFLGKVCTYGDDRHLTNLMLQKKYKIVYVDNAIAYTDVPTSIFSYVKQQLRWKKSFLRESLVILPYALKNSFLLSFEILLTLIIPFFSLLARLLIIYFLFTDILFLIPLVLSIALIAFIRNMFLFFDDPKVGFYSIPFAFFYEALIYWLYWVALFDMWNTKWGTR